MKKRKPIYLLWTNCDKEYKCTLDNENIDWGWFDIENLPKPLFPTLYSSLLRIL